MSHSHSTAAEPPILLLQRMIGNRAMSGLVNAGALGHPGLGHHTAALRASRQTLIPPHLVIQRLERQLSAAALRPLVNPEQDRFMRHVYNLQVAIWHRQGATYTARLGRRDLATLANRDTLPGRIIQIGRQAARDCHQLLDSARSALASAQRTGESSAANVTDVRARSAYRSPQKQFSIWERSYQQYYQETQAHRVGLTGGEHGEPAAQYLAEYINQRVFSPGYSPHQRGIAVDLTYLQRGRWAEASTAAADMQRWKRSWLFQWLHNHASQFGFVPNPNINEPWHWEHGNSGTS
jgi:hypothetical protein